MKAGSLFSFINLFIPTLNGMIAPAVGQPLKDFRSDAVDQGCIFFFEVKRLRLEIWNLKVGMV